MAERPDAGARAGLLAGLAQAGDDADMGCAGGGLRGRIFGERAGGEDAAEPADMAGELGKAESDQPVELEPVELADAVVELLAQPVAMAEQFAHRLGDLVMRMGGCRAPCEGGAGEAGGVGGIGLGALGAGPLEMAGDRRVHECRLVASGGEHGEEVCR
jgi:hypothetical protein